MEITISCNESKKAIEAILARDENHFCADCDEPNPTWVSLTWGCFICDNCAGAHRSLGPESSFLKSGTNEIFSQQEVDCLTLQGNVHANQILEYHVPEGVDVPHGANDKWQRRKTYIQKKYEDLSFIKLEGRERKSVKRESIIFESFEDNSLPFEDHFLGILDVKILSINNLPKSKFGNSGIYAITKIGTQQSKTDAKDFKEEIKFDEKFVFSWDGKEEMNIKICDKQKITKCKFLAEVKLQLNVLLETRSRQLKGTFPLYTKSNKSAGSIELEINCMSLFD
ncbi:ADP-ribosylation factor GTPase-activating protein AGD13-like [Oopsacas minuta]|uniref:ADP-ribosylation factor GTPase-activating protein AGD13-like n=1 Tax=Oopsacas minuta TaxID=111878 RepID=A0AAV7JJW1_9METZ|nr:ADP-ribosylation factor GTPase-activating protein AGD13-like [Oopsacas minuta]